MQNQAGRVLVRTLFCALFLCGCQLVVGTEDRVVGDALGTDASLVGRDAASESDVDVRRDAQAPDAPEADASEAPSDADDDAAPYVEPDAAQVCDVAPAHCLDSATSCAEACRGKACKRGCAEACRVCFQSAGCTPLGCAKAAGL